MSHFRMRLAIAVAALLSLLGAEAALASGVVISEFRVRGPNGAADEFVELHNASNAPVAIGGLLIRGSNNAGTVSTRATITAGTMLNAGCYYLVTNSSASGGPYSGSVPGDQTYATGITDDGGIALTQSDGTTIVDAVGMSAGSLYKEGTTLASLGSNNLDRGYERKPGGAGGNGQDTGDNAADFALITPSAPQNSLSTCISTGPPAPTNPSAVGAASPSSVLAGESTTLTATVTPGANPTSTGLAVNADLSSIGGSASQAFFDDGTNGDATAGDNVFTYAATVAGGTSAGPKTLPVSVMDAQTRSGATTISLMVTVPNPCAQPYTPIPAIQGSGLSAAITGTVTTRGVVVGDHEGASPALRGFYLQDSTGDGNAATSDAIFVFNGGNQNLVSVGDVVVVTGTAGENQDQTQVSTSAANIHVCGTGAVTPTDVTLPVASATFLERYEGMLVRMAQTLYVTEHFQLGRFGQVVLSSGDRLTQPTSVVAPGAAAIAMQEQNNLNRLILDDSSQFQNPDPIIWGRNGMPLSASNTLRGGDTVTGAVGVMTYTWAGNAASGNAYRLRPVNALGGSATFVAANPRPTATPDVGGRVQVAGMNVLNFFNTFTGCGAGVAGGPIDCRGANSATEFNRQWPKTVEAILATGADVVGLGEIENDGYGPTSAIQFLVDRLNDATAPGTWALIDADARSGQIDALGTDAIKVGLIYKPGVVTPVGTTGVLNSPAFVNGGDPAPRNRATLAQAFVDNVSGAIFVVTPNHLKSKGSACTAPDLGDGQGNCAVVRTNAATLLADWLMNQNPTGTGSRNVLIVGDLNSYAKEDPIAALEAAGFTNLISAHLGPDAYSYVFDGQWGYLDHALGSQAILSGVTGVAEFHINADEPAVLDYNVEFKSPGQVASLYAADMYRMSDHDPVVVGLQLDTTFASLCELVRLYSSNPDVADGLCAKLAAAAASEARGNEKSKAGQLKAFVNQVNAQRGKALTSAEADTLIALAGTL